MRRHRLISIFFVVLYASSQTARAANYESATTIVFDANIEGTLISAASVEVNQIAEVKQQLMYLQGVLSSTVHASPQLGRHLQISITGAEVLPDGLFSLSYSANTMIVWPRPVSVDLPLDTHTVLLPRRADAASMANFFLNYGADCGGSPDVIDTTFWYYYKPMLPTCPLRDSTLMGDVTPVTMNLSFSSSNSENAMPEYDRIWSDGQLVVTYIGGIAAENIELQAGVNLLNMLTTRYGPPVSGRNEAIFSQHKITTAQFSTPAGSLVVHAIDILTGSLESVEPELAAQFAELSAASDFVGYNGHSGLGANIWALERMANFAPNQYYLYWINACYPFSYLKEPLFNMVEAANPNDPWSRHLEVLSTAGIGGFSYGSDIVTLVSFLVAKTATYREMTQAFSSWDAAVIGEEDNPTRD